jgi:hypothetical protein
MGLGLDARSFSVVFPWQERCAWAACAGDKRDGVGRTKVSENRNTEESRATTLDSFLDELHSHRRDLQAAIVAMERLAGERPRARRLPPQLEELLARLHNGRLHRAGKSSNGNGNGRHRL